MFIYLLLAVLIVAALGLVWFLWRSGPRERERSIAAGTLLAGLIAALAAVLALAYRNRRRA